MTGYNKQQMHKFGVFKYIKQSHLAYITIILTFEQLSKVAEYQIPYILPYGATSHTELSFFI